MTAHPDVTITISTPQATAGCVVPGDVLDQLELPAYSADEFRDVTCEGIRQQLRNKLLTAQAEGLAEILARIRDID